MKPFLLLTVAVVSTFAAFSQENWDYLNFEASNARGAICPLTEELVHVVTDNGIFYKTVDGGINWTEFDSSIDGIFLDLEFDDSNTGFAVGSEGKIMKTANAGQEWNPLISGTAEDLVSVAVNAPNSIWAVGENGTILHSTNGGDTWVLDNSVANERFNSIKFKDENIGYIAGNNGILLYTSNGGTDWETLNVGTTDDLFSLSITETYTSFLAGGYAEDFRRYGNIVYKTVNNIDWEQFSLIGSLGGVSDMDFQNDTLGFEISSQMCLCNECYVKINKSIDGGENWIESLDETTNAANCNANLGYADIAFASEEVGYVLLGGRILKTPHEWTASAEDFDKNKLFTVFPNPTLNGNFNLKLSTPDTNGLSLEIMDLNGKLLMVKNELTEQNIINISHFNSGIYFIKLMKNGTMVGSRKLVKNN